MLVEQFPYSHRRRRSERAKSTVYRRTYSPLFHTLVPPAKAGSTKRHSCSTLTPQRAIQTVFQPVNHVQFVARRSAILLSLPEGPGDHSGEAYIATLMRMAQEQRKLDAA